MKGFDSKFIDELKTKCDIVDIAGKYVRLEQRGSNFWGNCPFHHEKTPSFCINSVGQFYYCFGCHKSGDVITMVMELESLDFNDAVKFLAEKVNMKLPEIQIDDEKIRQSKKQKDTVLQILKECARFYAQNLRSNLSVKHLEYVKTRGLTAKTLNMFGIGASNDYTSLVTHLENLGFSKEDMVLSGAVGKTERNGRTSYYDALAGRLIIPVLDPFNNVIAFCGRIIEKKENVGKYVNTKETIVFSKSKTLFNLNNLKKIKNEKGLSEIIIVEGHMDVISLVQNGIENVVASMGTALTKDHARILKRYASSILISYDGDGAGKNATIRGLEILKEEGLDVKVVCLPDGKDPDEVIKTHGKEGYEKLVKNAMPLIDFKIEVLKNSSDLNSSDGKRKFVSSAIKIIKESPSPAEQEELLKTVRDLTNITYESLKRELYSQEESNAVKKVQVPYFTDNVGDKTAIASRFVLAGFLFDKPYVEGFDIKDVQVFLPVHERIKNYILSKNASGKKLKFNELYELEDEELSSELGRIAGLESEENKKFDQKKYFNDCLKTLKEEFIKKEISRLTALFSKENDLAKRAEIAKELSIMAKEKKKLSIR